MRLHKLHTIIIIMTIVHVPESTALISLSVASAVNSGLMKNWENLKGDVIMKALQGD